MISKTTFLYVDDDKAIIEFAKVLFRKVGISTENITYAYDGEEALELYKKNNYDIVITDMIMPKMNGFELITKIKEINTKQLSIMISGMDTKEDLINAIELGINYFIEKPIKLDKFKDILDKCIERSNNRKQSKLSSLLLKQYKDVIDDSTIVSKTDTKGIITYVNDQFCKISGYKREELIGKPQNIVRDPETDKEIFEFMWFTIKELKQAWTGELKNRTKKGKPYWVKATIRPILDQNGNILEYIAIRTDITQQEKIKQYFETQLHISSKQFNKALNLSKEYERAINESTILTRTDLDGNITYVNDKFLEVTGYKEDEIIGKNHNIVRHPDEKKEVFENLWNTIKEGKVWHGILKNISKYNEEYWVDTFIVPILNEKGEVLEYMSIRNNITELFKLTQEIEDTQKEVVFTMGAIGETRSKETGNHVKRVAEYSYLLARLYGLDEKESELIKMASPMHDIGKVGIPDDILNKPGRLTKEEFEIMKTHSEIGYDMLKGSSRPILRASAHIALEHHERWDGKGYPRGLSGEDIHIYGRITAICDVFDALGSDRCYKKAWDLEKILKLFKVESGQQFDPKLMNLFLDNLDKFLKIRDSYVD